jgi:hypothetical protein
MTPWFIATEQFTPEDESWNSFIQFSGLTQLKELVSLDSALCPTILPTSKAEYWPHIVTEDHMLNFFLDFDFLIEQIKNIERKNVLCVFRNPQQMPTAPSAANFKFIGYDLLEVNGGSGISALTNCGGFPDVFANAELSEVGLLTDFGRASKVQSLLRSLHPNDPHANCDLWAIFRAAE